MPFEPFQIGRYRCIHELGAGSTASVYIARYHGVEGFEKLVALKRVHDHVARDPEFVRRFILEARLGAALSHAGIVRVLECVAEGDTYVMASELVDGISARQLLTSLDRRGRRIPPGTAVAMVALVADALDFAHRFTDLTGRDVGVVHGGLRPSKVLLPKTRGVKILDFGVAESFAYARRSAPSVDWADYAYLAPETVTTGVLSPQTDCFALGAILYEMVTCEPLFLRSDPGRTLQAVQEAQVPRHAALPDVLRDIICSSVAADVGLRVASAADLHDDLLRWLAQERLTPSRAWSLSDMQELYADWAIRLPAPSLSEPSPEEVEIRARRQAVTVVRSGVSAGAPLWDPGESTAEDPWDPLFALSASLKGSGGSHVTGLSAAWHLPEGGGSVGTTDFADSEEDATLEREYQAASPTQKFVRMSLSSEDVSGSVGSAPERSDPGPYGTGRPERERRLEALVGELEALVLRSPGDPAVRTELAGVYRQIGRLDAAESTLGGVLEREPRFAPAWHQLGLLAQQRGRSQEALRAFQRALVADPSFREARVALAVAYLALGEVDDAIAELTAVLTSQWRSGVAHRLLARCFIRAGDPRAALEHCDYAASFGEEVGALRQEILGYL